MRLTSTLLCGLVLSGCFSSPNGTPATSPRWQWVSELAMGSPDLHGPPTWSVDGSDLYGILWSYEEERISDDLVYGYKERRSHEFMVFAWDPETDARTDLLDAPLPGRPLRLHTVGDDGFVLKWSDEAGGTHWTYAPRVGPAVQLGSDTMGFDQAFDMLPSADGRTMARLECASPNVEEVAPGQFESTGPVVCDLAFLDTLQGHVVRDGIEVSLGYAQDVSSDIWTKRNTGLGSWDTSGRFVVSNWDDEAVAIDMDGTITPVDVPCLRAPRTAASPLSIDGVLATIDEGALRLEDASVAGLEPFGCTP
jgi:hypothetical protein